MTLFLNQAGTSWPKPAPVRDAVAAALIEDPSSWADSFADRHLRIAAWFGVSDPAQLLLTPGGTSSLHTVVSRLPWVPGETVITTALEHEALAVPVRALVERGVSRVRIPRWRTWAFDLDAFERAVAQPGVRLVAVTAVSNVTGERFPIEEIVAVAHEHDVACLVDASQLVGWEKLDLPALDADYVAFAGHKALHGVWGIGGLYVAPDARGGGDPVSWCDVGSVDRAAMAGLAAAVDWLDAPEQVDRLARASALTQTLVEKLSEHEPITLLGREGPGWRLPTVAFVVAGRPAGEVAAALREREVIVSGGHQCAPEAHAVLGSEGAAVRVSFGAHHTEEDLARLLEALGAVLP